MHFLLIISNPRLLRHVRGLVDASRGRGHDVTVFFNEESVKLLTDHAALRGIDAEMIACVTACQYMGITEDSLAEGSRVTSFAEV
ncbi:hypothetical protein JXL21_08620, partial [Candidatus Bathyarchaeota archaeon]|nr:hypothetical protein [Candidatus Bathyarchaeota archaeon]